VDAHVDVACQAVKDKEDFTYDTLFHCFSIDAEYDKGSILSEVARFLLFSQTQLALHSVGWSTTVLEVELVRCHFGGI